VAYLVFSELSFHVPEKGWLEKSGVAKASNTNKYMIFRIAVTSVAEYTLRIGEAIKSPNPIVMLQVNSRHRWES
jgi:hypothetical protein